MQYVYVLQCKGGRFYTGYSSNLKQRLRQHQHGEVVSTRHRVPVELVYYEACIEKADAKAREKYLKSTYGKQELRKRLKVFFKKPRVSRLSSFRPTLNLLKGSREIQRSDAHACRFARSFDSSQTRRSG